MNKLMYRLKNAAPIIGFLLVCAFFAVTTGGTIFSVSNLQSLMNQVIVLAMVSLGAVFVFGAGEFDLSLGGCVCISAVLGCMAAISTGSILLAFVICLGVSMVLGVLKGIFSSYIKVPMFIVTIVLNMVISAVVLVIMGKETTIYLRNAVPEIRALTFSEMTVVNVVTLGLFLLATVILFNYTSLGRTVKFIGGNEAAAKQTGLNIRKAKILSYLICAVGLGLAAFIILIRTRTVGNTTGGDLGFDVLVALVLGGMPINGGPRARISAGFFGAATITVLNSGLVMMGMSIGGLQTVRGIVFLAIVFVASFTYRTKLLPR